jgi:protein-S-isoprenylcysteine O-methyltransferase Ste14
LPLVWAFFGIFGGFLFLAWLLIFRRDPDLLQERQKPGPEAKDWDRRLLRIYGWLLLATWIFALLDVGRLHWSDTVPLGLQIGGLLLATGALALTGRALAENAFFSEVVRIQRDRGHRVITTGPYRYVRHPGYLGNVLTFPSVALALGSWGAVGLSFGLVALFVWRTALEDRTLQAELEGYADYAARVRYRLVPGIW